MHRFTIVEHAIEQRRVHRNMLMQLRNSPDQTRLEDTTSSAAAASSSSSVVGGGGEDSSDDSDSEEEQSELSEEEMDLDGYYFLQVSYRFQVHCIISSKYGLIINSLNFIISACTNKTETCLIKSSWSAED